MCMLMLASPKDPLAKTYIRLIKDAGYDYAELPLAKLYSLSTAELADYRDEFKKAELRTEAFNNGIVPHVKLLGSDIKPSAWDAYIERAIYLSNFFGIRMLTTSSPHKTNEADEHFYEHEGRMQYVEFLKTFAAACNEFNITIALEPICTLEDGFVATTSEALSLIELAGAKNLGLVLDFYHFRLMDEDFSIIPELVRTGTLRHLHFADSNERRFPYLGNKAEYINALMPVLNAGYAGRLSVEAVPSQLALDIKNALAPLEFLRGN